jgi:hypothetical protein
MYYKKKEKLYLSEIMEDPAITYPAYYILSQSMAKNEMLHSALISLHMYDFSYYHIPKNFDEIFKICDSGTFPIYKEKYIIGYFGNKMMYLESYGWKAMPVTKELFILSNWLV